ncbi:peroxiredoxin [Plasticicumulans lactativorans]|uniref:Peroxiredoxin n=1 Tax=Plasticicumulans lactativorans TaxID=1133106 RepID=A0A4R2L006_9GAMM|nr:thioredoxin family protein [Plasticicumulans lactativorans]TCO79724.1 peroxiredoxin [Plasticicumulans lactativorans]
MVLQHTPVCAFGTPAPDFRLPGVDGRDWTRADCAGPRGLLVMFICNHCPYVKAIRPRLVEDVRVLQALGIGCVAISANDPADYPEDGFAPMAEVARRCGFTFPYLFDASQEVARAYGAVCTPDFFGYNAAFELQYRGRLDASGREPAAADARRELVEAMRQVADSGHGPAEQVPSMGCSIKWRAA